MKGCPLCGDEPQRVIYFGFPMKLCMRAGCQCLWGLWSFVAVYGQVEDGGWTFVPYEKGGYWRALWWFLFGPRPTG